MAENKGKKDEQGERGNWVSLDGQAGKPRRSMTSMRWMGLGIEIAAIVVIFSYVGWWGDQKLGHHFPYLTVSGFVFSFVGRMYLLFKETKSDRSDE